MRYLSLKESIDIALIKNCSVVFETIETNR